MTQCTIDGLTSKVICFPNHLKITEKLCQVILNIWFSHRTNFPIEENFDFFFHFF